MNWVFSYDFKTIADDPVPSDNGPTSKKFFSDKPCKVKDCTLRVRDHILDLFRNTTPSERADLDKAMSYSNVIMRVVNSSQKVHITEFDSYVREAYEFRVKLFDFWPINDSVHRIWGHCIWTIRELGGFSGGLISETPLESCVCIHIKPDYSS